MTVTLVVPFGAQGNPISYGTVDYSPMAYRADITNSNSPWLVDVPAHVAERLCHNAGFYLYVPHQAGEPAE
jgi:hypothetical protein